MSLWYRLVRAQLILEIRSPDARVGIPLIPSYPGLSRVSKLLIEVSRPGAAEREVTDRRAELGRLETSRRTTPDPTLRQEIEDRLRELQRLLREATTELQRLRTEEANLSNVVSTEQGRWTSFNQQFEDLDRILQQR